MAMLAYSQCTALLKTHVPPVTLHLVLTFLDHVHGCLLLQA
jgi:hypothetical protein